MRETDRSGPSETGRARQETGVRGDRQETGVRGDRQETGVRGDRQENGVRGTHQENGVRGARQENGDRPGYDAFVSAAEATVREYSPAEAIDRVGDRALRFVDVRDAVELSNGTISGAIHAPGGRLEARLLPDNPRYVHELEDAVEIVFVCASGTRSALAAHRAKQLGYDRVGHLGGGISAWRDAGGPMYCIDDRR